MARDGDLYGRGPIMDAIPLLRAWNELPAGERHAACARFIEDRMRANASGTKVSRETARKVSRSPRVLRRKLITD